MGLALATVCINIRVRVRNMPEAWARPAGANIHHALARVGIHGVAELVAVIVINILAQAAVMLPAVRVVLVTVNILLAVVQVLIHGLMVRAFVQVHINTLVQERVIRAVQARLVMVNTLLVIAQVVIAGMVRHANTAVVLINTPARELATLVVLVALAVVYTLLVIARVVIAGMVHRANIVAALISTPVRVVIFPEDRAVLAVVYTPLVIAQVHTRGLMVLVFAQVRINILVRVQDIPAVQVVLVMANILLVIVLVDIVGQMELVPVCLPRVRWVIFFTPTRHAVRVVR